MSKEPDTANRPNQDTATTAGPSPLSGRRPVGHEPRGVDEGIADADKIARTGSKDEPAYNTPPGGEDEDPRP